MNALAETFPILDAAEYHRQRMLAESDSLLERVEELRLADRPICPRDLADAIRALQIRLGRVPADRPRTVRAAHHMIFSVQARLMAANPRHPHPRALTGRPSGVPRLTVLRRGGAWKFLALPPPPPSAAPAAGEQWQHLVRLTVGRALDRWICAQDQAVRAARVREGAVRALHRAEAAWRNYWDLRCEAEWLLGRAVSIPPGPPHRRPGAVHAWPGARRARPAGRSASPAAGRSTRSAAGRGVQSAAGRSGPPGVAMTPAAGAYNRSRWSRS